MKKSLIIFSLFTIVFFINPGNADGYCGEFVQKFVRSVFPKTKNKFYKNLQISTVTPTGIVYFTTYYTFSAGATSATFSDCDVRGLHGLNNEDKEKVLFLAYGMDGIMTDSVRRGGESVGIAVEAMGCGREKYFGAVNSRFGEIYGTGEPGITYLIRMNRVLEGVCEKTSVRLFLSELDDYYTPRFPGFPYVLPGNFPGPPPDSLASTID